MRVDVSDVAPSGCRTLALEVVAPPPVAAAPPVVLFCFPGGGMSRRYFDLTAPGYSFAEYASERGFVVILADHPGVGDSDAPDDGWTLTPETVALADCLQSADQKIPGRSPGRCRIGAGVFVAGVSGRPDGAGPEHGR